ncbi:MAG: type secretion exporter [Gemmatimonadetes bacterium]|nr:type secretion exporter [Gemmatimonadota bacterium]
MSDEPGSEKTEEASDHKKQTTHEEGRIPKSQELTVAIMLIGSALVLKTAAGPLAMIVTQTSGDLLANAGTLSLTEGSATALIRQIGWRMVAALGAFLGAMALVSLSITVAQARGVMSLTPITPSFKKLNPLANARRILGVQSVVELGKSLGKVGLVSGVVYVALKEAMPDALRLAENAPTAFLPMVEHYVIQLLMSAGCAYLALAGGDYLYQWWSFQKQLRMTKEEVKQENKQQNGDPQIRGRRRQIARSYARRQMLKDVPRADVIIVNPTHIAIAIKYDPTLAPAPIVLALGQRLVAERIKAIAMEHGVPIIQNKPVARALIKTARVGTLIPVEMYMAVAEILAYVLRTRATRGSWAGSASA